MMIQLSMQTNEEINVKHFLIKHHFSRRLLKKDLNIKVNYFPGNLQTKLHINDVITVDLPSESSTIIPYATDIHILYEDDYLLIVDKPACLQTIPSKKEPVQALANAVLYYYLQTNQTCGIHILTRLDKETSGIVLFAKHQYIQSLLHNKKIHKKYFAFTTNPLPQNNGIIRLPILKKEDTVQRTIDAKGVIGISEYRLIQQTPYCYEVQLHTGKTHQIRVHFAYYNAPLIGDQLYGSVDHRCNRVALHCQSIDFIHPIYQKELLIESVLPADLKKLKGD